MGMGSLAWGCHGKSNRWEAVSRILDPNILVDLLQKGERKQKHNKTRASPLDSPNGRYASLEKPRNKPQPKKKETKPSQVGNLSNTFGLCQGIQGDRQLKGSLVQFAVSDEAGELTIDQTQPLCWLGLWKCARIIVGPTWSAG